jgi:hypothetical protein
VSLKSFHLLFIAASTLLAFGFTAWCLAAGEAPSTTGRIVAGAASAAFGLGLVGYEAWFLKKMRGVS